MVQQRWSPNGTVVQVFGEPVASFEFFDISTWNTHSTASWKKQMGLKQKWRAAGNELASDFMLARDMLWGDEKLVNTALVLVKVLPPKEEISDIHNVCLKHIFDGFTDAGVWADDEWATVPLVIIMWAGIDQDVQWKKKRAHKNKRRRMAEKRRTIIEIHELATFIINGTEQRLPAGRRRL